LATANLRDDIRGKEIKIKLLHHRKHAVFFKTDKLDAVWGAE
jgi:hypothetical protein